jgi:hypothetical protein
MYLFIEAIEVLKNCLFFGGYFFMFFIPSEISLNAALVVAIVFDFAKLLVIASF